MSTIFWTFVIIVFIIILIRSSEFETFQSFGLTPRLYSTTSPVDMLMMKKYLLMNGYRFQNSLSSPEPINFKQNNITELGSFNNYPDVYQQRTGVFKQNAFFEGFTSKPLIENFLESVSTGTITQMNSLGQMDYYLIGQKGQAIENSKENIDPHGKYNYARPEDHFDKYFSWGDIINRFYKNPVNQATIRL
jgi:hypothetical protein